MRDAHTVQLKAAIGFRCNRYFCNRTDKGYKAVFTLMVLQQTLEFLKLPLGEANEVTLTGTETLTNKTLTAS